MRINVDKVAIKGSCSTDKSHGIAASILVALPAGYIG